MTSIYAAKWHEMHTTERNRLCDTCGASLQVRTIRGTDETITLDAWPHHEGIWQADAEGRAYRSEHPVHAYELHRCEGDE